MSGSIPIALPNMSATSHSISGMFGDMPAMPAMPSMPSDGPASDDAFLDPVGKLGSLVTGRHTVVLTLLKH